MTSAVTNGLSEIATGTPEADEARIPESADLHHRWAEFVAQKLCSFSIESQRENSFRVNARARSEGGFVVARFTTVAGRANLERTPSEIGRDGRDGYCLYVPLAGEHGIRQCHR